MTLSGLKFFIPTVMSQRRWQRLLLHLVRSPAHCASALNCGRENIGKTHSILHFVPQTHQKTATVVSASYIFHGKQPQAQKSKAQCHHPGIQEIPESLSFITKIICEHKQMWSTNMSFNWEGRWSHVGWDGSEQRLWKTKHLRRPWPSISVAPTGRQGLGLKPTRLKQNSLLLPQWDTHTQASSQQQVVLGFQGEFRLSTSSSLLCLSSAVSLIALGMKPLPPWPETPNADMHW